MQTKYILIGGYPFKSADGGQSLCLEMVKGFNGDIKILDCLFARPVNKWDEVYINETSSIKENLPAIELNFKLADPSNFEEQIKWANILYISGGEDKLLKSHIQNYPNWVNLLADKTIVGSSAGAYLLSKYWYSIDFLHISEGLGLVDVKTIAHWKSDYNYQNVNWDKAYLELKNYKEDLPVLTLAEGEFVVL